MPETPLLDIQYNKAITGLFSHTVKLMDSIKNGVVSVINTNGKTLFQIQPQINKYKLMVHILLLCLF